VWTTHIKQFVTPTCDRCGDRHHAIPHFETVNDAKALATVDGWMITEWTSDGGARQTVYCQKCVAELKKIQEIVCAKSEAVESGGGDSQGDECSGSAQRLKSDLVRAEACQEVADKLRRESEFREIENYDYDYLDW
jgi:hypothetical protein